jgi:Undecaprenyl-phosphate glucose phosphotransferase
MVAEIEQGVRRSAQTRQISPTFVQNLVLVLDPAIVTFVGLICYAVYLATRETNFETQFIIATIMGGIFSAAFFQWFDAYPREFLFSRRQPIQRLSAGWACAFAVLLFIAFALKISDSFSRIWAVAWFFAAASGLVATRLMLSFWIANRVREGALAERTIILGAGEQGQRFAAHIRNLEDPCTRVLGFVDDRTSRVPHSSHGYEVLGNTQDLFDMIRANQVDQVFVALPWAAGERISELIKSIALTPIRICLVTEPLGFDPPPRSVRFVGKVPTLQIFDHPLSGWSYVTKGIEDRLLSFLILLFIAPLMCVIALAIKLDSPGPVLFRQQRFGFNNQLIEVWKFRTMYLDQSDLGGAVQARQDDPRVTRLGRFLRKSSLDELPQFLNVLMGDMSIVGPRPHPVELTSGGRRFEEIVDRYAARHRVKPGITGWAQVNGWRGETDSIDKLEGRVEHDLYYIDNWSVWFDLVIIMKTLIVMLKDENAY